MLLRASCIAALLGALACGPVRSVAISQAAVVLADGARAFEAESDIELARLAFPGSLKTLEGLLQAQPEQRELLLILAEAWSGYAFGFLEDEAEDRAAVAPAEADVLRQRAVALHLRSRDYGLRLLALDLPELAAILRQGTEPTEEQLDAAWSRRHLEALFWTANAWGLAINAGRDQPALVAQAGIVRALATRCAAIDETFSWGGPHLLLGGLEAGVPAALGGQPEVAKQHFQRAIAIAEGKQLMAKVLYARTVGPATGDRKLFDDLLHDVLASSPDAHPRLVLQNHLAQRRARRYLAAAPDLFL